MFHFPRLPRTTALQLFLSGWGEIEIIVFPPGSEIPSDLQASIARTLHQ
jgi:hypothetical protein